MYCSKNQPRHCTTFSESEFCLFCICDGFFCFYEFCFASTAPSPASKDLVGRSKGAANDAVLLREIIESNDSASVAAAFAALLAACSCSAPPSSMLRKKAFLRLKLLSHAESHTYNLSLGFGLVTPRYFAPAACKLLMR